MGLFAKTTKTETKAKKPAAKTAKAEVKATEKKESMKDLYGIETATKAVTKTKSKNNQAYKILMKPLVTEKSSIMAEQGKYVFAVAIKANKIEVAKAINEIYNVKPVNVNIICMGGKVVRRGRITGKRSDWKKAIVTLAKGQSIKIYEGI